MESLLEREMNKDVHGAVLVIHNQEDSKEHTLIGRVIEVPPHTTRWENNQWFHLKSLAMLMILEP